MAPLLDSIVARLVEACQPERVALSGSWARGGGCCAQPSADLLDSCELFVAACLPRLDDAPSAPA